VDVEELQHLALGDDVGRIGEHRHHAQASHVHHHLEGARVEEVPDQHRRGVAELGIGGVLPAPQARLVHHVVVEERGRMDEFDDRGQLVLRGAFGAAGIRGQQEERGAQALPAALDDVVGDRADEDDVGSELPADDVVDAGEILRDRIANRLERSGRSGRVRGRRQLGYLGGVTRHVGAFKSLTI
jgi:hypothetical protein